MGKAVEDEEKELLPPDAPAEPGRPKRLRDEEEEEESKPCAGDH
jgi:hypothetical protein